MIPSQTQSLAEVDPIIADLIEQEKARQFRGLEMIASENFTSRAVIECLGSALTNKYAEGEVGARYYGGTEVVDKIEALAKQRALAAFSLDPAEWGVNVQPYSGSPANFAVYTGLLRPHDRIMGLDLPSGGHLTHGFYTAKKKVSATSIFFESLPYKITDDGIIDYAGLERSATDFRPQLIIIGGSAYPRDYDYVRVRKLCDTLGCLLFMDMAHSAGLIASGCLKSPFEFCDVVTTTTHKSLRGPRSGMIFYRKKKINGEPTDYESRINQAVFPGLQGGPHMHQIAAIATQMREVATPEFKKYAQQVQENCRVLADELTQRGHTLASGGTDNHLILWNLRPHGLTGARLDKTLEAVSITVNKNAIAGDKSALNPGGVRIGTCALTSRGMDASHMKIVAGFLEDALQIALRLNPTAAKLDEFVAAVGKDAAVTELRGKVEAFATSFAMPGFDVATLKYKDGLPTHE